MSVMVALLTLSYLLNNLIVMARYKGTNVSTTTLESNFSTNDTFTQDDGFRIALGFPYVEEYLEFSAFILSADFT